MPPHRPRRHPSHPPPPHPPRRAASAAAASELLEPRRLEALLAPFMPDAEDRAFVVRCILKEGPVHHRVASYALLLLAGRVLERAGGVMPATEDRPSVPVPLRLPPHVRRGDDDDAHYPLRMPTAALGELAPGGSSELAALVGCLLDGPPHHALANAALVSLLDALAARLGGPSR